VRPGHDLPPEDLLGSPAQARPLRKLPVLLWAGTKLVWAAGKRELAVSTALQVFAMVGLGAELFIGRRLLRDLLALRDRAGDPARIAREVALLAVVGFLVRLATTTQTELQRILAELTSRYSRSRILGAAGEADIEAFDDPDFYNRLRRAEVNAQIRPFQLVSGMMGLLSGSLGVAAALVVLFSAQPLIVPLVLAGFVPLWLANKGSGRAFYEFSFRMTPLDRERDYLGSVLTGKDSIKEVRAFGLSGFLGDRFNVLYERRISDLRKVVRRRLGRLILAGLSAAVLGASVLGFIIVLLVTNRIGLAEAGTAAGAVLLLGQRLQLMGSSGGRLYETALFLEDFTSFLESAKSSEKPSAEQPEEAPAKRQIAPFEELIVDDLWFSYPGSQAPVLRGVGMSIKKGEVVALVGENGSGKTTLARLLAHLYRPASGRILWDGHDTEGLDADDLRSSIALVFQDFLRYQLPAKDNIGLGRHDRFEDLPAIVEAAKRSGAHDFVSDLPSSYQTYLSRMFSGGRELSSGQWQQIALARAFFRDAPFIILDEPTAALDPKAEHRLFEAVRDLWQGRSVLVISHRFSSVRTADRIYVMKAGQIAERGTHDQLMELGGLYAELFSLQAESYSGGIKGTSS